MNYEENRRIICFMGCVRINVVPPCILVCSIPGCQRQQTNQQKVLAQQMSQTYYACSSSKCHQPSNLKTGS